MEENNTPQSINQTSPAQTPSDQPINSVYPPPVSKPKGKKPLFVTIGIVLFLLIAGGAAAGFIYKDKLSNLVSKPTPTPLPSSAETSVKEDDPTENWKTFNDTKNGISIRIPPDWDTGECPDKNIQNNPSIIQICSSEKFGDPIEPIIYGITIAKQEDTGKEQFEKYDKSIQKVGGQPIKRDKYTFNEDPINGMPVFRTDVLNQVYGQDSVFFRTKDGKSVALIFRPYVRTQPWLEQERFYKIFNQILSTFRFTDSQTLDTSTWKTYKGLSFTFKHPSNWVEEHISDSLKNKEDIERVDYRLSASFFGVKYGNYNYEEYIQARIKDDSKKINVGGKEAMIFETKGVQNSLLPNGYSIINVIVKSTPTTSYIISFNGDRKEINDSLINHILSTFKFTP